MIESYKFGAIVINGKKYTSDIIVFPEHVIDGWWRKEGHRLHVEDIEDNLARAVFNEIAWFLLILV